jgi:predicted RNase H-like HicB family nuclease
MRRGAQMKDYTVEATWDDEARVWVATSVGTPGLATEAETVEALTTKLKVIIPELLECSGKPAASIPFHLHTHRHDIALTS